MLMRLFNYGIKSKLFLFMVWYDKVFIIVFVFNLREYYIYNKINEDYN